MKHSYFNESKSLFFYIVPVHSESCTSENPQFFIGEPQSFNKTIDTAAKLINLSDCSSKDVKIIELGLSEDDFVKQLPRSTLKSFSDSNSLQEANDKRGKTRTILDQIRFFSITYFENKPPMHCQMTIKIHTTQKMK